MYGRNDDYFKGLKLIAAKPVQRKSDNENKMITNMSMDMDIKMTMKMKKMSGNFLQQYLRKY